MSEADEVEDLTQYPDATDDENRHRPLMIGQPGADDQDLPGISGGSPSETSLEAVTDEVLDATLDKTLADFGLAEKYEHNAHLRPAIRATLDKLYAEKKRRLPPSIPIEGSPPTWEQMAAIGAEPETERAHRPHRSPAMTGEQKDALVEGVREWKNRVVSGSPPDATERETLERELGITLPSTCEVFCDDGACAAMRALAFALSEARAEAAAQKGAAKILAIDVKTWRSRAEAFQKQADLEHRWGAKLSVELEAATSRNALLTAQFAALSDALGKLPRYEAALEGYVGEGQWLTMTKDATGAYLYRSDVLALVASSSPSPQ